MAPTAITEQSSPVAGAARDMGEAYGAIRTRGVRGAIRTLAEDDGAARQMGSGMMSAVLGTVVAVLLTAIIATQFLNLDIVSNNTMFEDEIGQLQSIIGAVLVLMVLVPLVLVASRLTGIFS